jgi:GH24 family phage-related lysozyme (muramidase)
MKTKQVLFFGVAAFFLLLLMQGPASVIDMMSQTANFIASLEGFRAHPYWDVSRYSWGYGTQAPGATGTITEAQARLDLMQASQDNYDYLNPLIYVPLKPQQWAALLSFAYNEGPGNADNLVDNINAEDNEALGAQWALYNKVRINGVLTVSQNLVSRRAKEWAMWNS